MASRHCVSGRLASSAACPPPRTATTAAGTGAGVVALPKHPHSPHRCPSASSVHGNAGFRRRSLTRLCRPHSHSDAAALEVECASTGDSASMPRKCAAHVSQGYRWENAWMNACSSARCDSVGCLGNCAIMRCSICQVPCPSSARTRACSSAAAASSSKPPDRRPSRVALDVAAAASHTRQHTTMYSANAAHKADAKRGAVNHVLPPAMGRRPTVPRVHAMRGGGGKSQKRPWQRLAPV